MRLRTCSAHNCTLSPDRAGVTATACTIFAQHGLAEPAQRIAGLDLPFPTVKECATYLLQYGQGHAQMGEYLARLHDEQEGSKIDRILRSMGTHSLPYLQYMSAKETGPSKNSCLATSILDDLENQGVIQTSPLSQTDRSLDCAAQFRTRMSKLTVIRKTPPLPMEFSANTKKYERLTQPWCPKY